jgi:ketosteroid isomerase-like protein
MLYAQVPSIGGSMHYDTNTQAVRQIYEAFDRKDIDTILHALGEDIEWHQPGPTDALP